MSLTGSSDSRESEGGCRENTSSHTHFFSPCQFLQRSPHYFSLSHAHARLKNQMSLSLWAPLKESSPSTHHVSPWCPAHHFIVLFHATFFVTEYTAHDWNQVSRKRNSAVGWIVWSSGRLHSNHKIRRSMQTLRARCRWEPHWRMVVDALTTRHGNSITRLWQLQDGVLSIVMCFCSNVFPCCDLLQ